MEQYQYLDENEQYQQQCAELFLTTKGRLIFHCSLCENKFLGFDAFEIHLKDHIPILDGGRMETDETEFMENIDAIGRQLSPSEIKIENNAMENSSNIEAVESQSSTSLIKIENNAMDNSSDIDAIESQSPPSPIKIENNAMDNSSDNSSDIDAVESQSSLSSIKIENNAMEKASDIYEQNRPASKTMQNVKQNKITAKNRKARQLPNVQSSTKKKYKDHSNDDIKIPIVVREVQRSGNPLSSQLISPEELKHKCPVCDVAFKERRNMVIHLKRHSGNKDQKCPKCNKAFYTLSDVNSHMRSHKPFVCNVSGCSRSFDSNDRLLEHLQMHSTERKHKCDICYRAFFNKTDLKLHIAHHSEERPFSCETCTASFTRHQALINHLKIHENKRSYKCQHCDSAFNQRAGLFLHIKKKHNISN